MKKGKATPAARAPGSEPTAAGEFSGFGERTFSFLSNLEKNNTSQWFNDHREDYDEGYVGPAKAFVSAVGPRLRAISESVAFEPRVNGSIFRIQRDTRFSKDKTPYKAHLDLWFWEGDRRGWGSPGFFFRLSPDQLILGAGMHQFEKPMLELYRGAVLDPASGAALHATLAEVRSRGPYVIGGNTRKSVPRGFDASHERAGYLLFEGLHASLEVPIPEEARGPGFVDYCVRHFEAVWPVSRWLRGLGLAAEAAP